jgi:hypothetical protein
MTVYNLYVLDRNGQSLYYREWLREKNSKLSRSEEDKLMAGLIFSLSNFCKKMSLQPDGSTFKSLKVSTLDTIYKDANCIFKLMRSFPIVKL